MSLLENLKKQLIRDEGNRLTPYVDSVGKLTVGVGRNLTDKGISAAESTYLLENDINETIQNVDAKLPWACKIDEARRGALLNLAFNMGVPKLLTFVNMLGYARNGLWEKAATELLDSKYAAQVGARALRLADQLRTGEWR